jgi:phage portal protein BeeE
MMTVERCVLPDDEGLVRIQTIGKLRNITLKAPCFWRFFMAKIRRNTMKKFFKNLKTAWPKRSSGHVNMLAMGSVGKPVFTPRYYEQLADEGYQRNVIVFRCVNLIARGLGSVPWLLYRNGSDQELERHPLLTLLNCPSPHQAGSAFMEAVVSHLLLSGNAYVEAVLDNYGVQELYALRPDIAIYI